MVTKDGEDGYLGSFDNDRFGPLMDAPDTTVTADLAPQATDMHGECPGCYRTAPAEGAE